MKKSICLLSALYFSLSATAFENMVEKSDEMKVYLPNADESLTFKENPIKFLEAIQLDYHFNKYDDGLKRVEEALSHVKPLYEEDKNQVVFPAELKEGEAYKVYAGLHTLKGMMLSKRAVSHAGVNADNNDEDGQRQKAIEDMQAAEQSLKTAVEADPTSPEAYFQLGKYYTAASAGLESKEAEDAFYNAARLAGEQGNEKGSQQALAQLQLLNPNSEYIEKLSQ